MSLSGSFLWGVAEYDQQSEMTSSEFHPARDDSLFRDRECLLGGEGVAIIHSRPWASLMASAQSTSEAV
jgi:hypothetical protein